MRNRPVAQAPPPLPLGPFPPSDGVVAVVSPLPALKELPMTAAAAASGRCNGGLITFGSKQQHQQQSVFNDDDPSMAYSVRTSL